MTLHFRNLKYYNKLQKNNKNEKTNFTILIS